jgi:hypothetical protein
VSSRKRAVVWLRLQRGGRRAVEVGIDPTQVDRALAKWRRLLGTTGRLEVNVYPARDDAGPPNPVFGLPDLHDDPIGAVAGHLVDEHGIGDDTTSWLAEHEGLVGLVGEHDLDHTEHHPGQQLGHTHPTPW